MTTFISTSLNVVNIAVSCFAASSLSAIRKRRRVIGTRFSGREPPSTLTEEADLGCPARSSFTIRPPLPEPDTCVKFTSFSAANRRTEGEEAASFGASSLALGTFEAADCEPGSKLAKATSPVTTSPAFFKISFNTPSSGAGTSNTTLSVSKSNKFSPRFTKSPGFLCHEPTVASATDSGKAGTLISITMFSFLFSTLTLPSPTKLVLPRACAHYLQLEKLMHLDLRNPVFDRPLN